MFLSPNRIVVVDVVVEPEKGMMSQMQRKTLTNGVATLVRGN